jgi:hypothetical protein
MVIIEPIIVAPPVVVEVPVNVGVPVDIGAVEVSIYGIAIDVASVNVTPVDVAPVNVSAIDITATEAGRSVPNCRPGTASASASCNAGLGQVQPQAAHNQNDENYDIPSHSCLLHLGHLFLSIYTTPRLRSVLDGQNATGSSPDCGSMARAKGRKPRRK